MTDPAKRERVSSMGHGIVTPGDDAVRFPTFMVEESRSSGGTHAQPS